MIVHRPPKRRAVFTAGVAVAVASTLARSVLVPAEPALAQAPVEPTVVLRVYTPAPPDQPPRPSTTPTIPPPTETRVPPSATPAPPRTVEAPDFPTETEPAPVLPNEERPVIVVDGYDVSPDQPAPGSAFRLTLFVRNAGEHFAENVQLTLSSATFLPAGHGGVLFANSIDEGETVALDVDLRVASDAKSGVYPLAIDLRWDDSYGDRYTDETSIGINVGAASATRPVVAIIASRLPGRVAAGAPFNLTFDLLNTGGRDALNVMLAPTGGPLALQGGGGPLNIPPGAHAQVSLRAVASPPGSPGAATQSFELRYDDADAVRYTESHSVGVVVTDDAALGPQPIVTAYRVRGVGVSGSTDGDATLATLAPGQVFELELDVLNHGVGGAQNTRLSFGGGSAPSTAGTGTSGASGATLGVFAPVGTSNVRFLGHLAAGASQTVTQRMVIDGAAKPGVYVLDIAFSFVDGNGQALTSDEVISLLVDREVLFEVNPIDVVTSTVAGDTLPFVVDLINLGTNTVNAANAELIPGRALSLADPSTARQYVGPLDAGGFFTFETTLLAETPGPSQAQLVVEYIDNFNQTQTYRATFDFEVQPAPEEPELPAAPEPEPPNIVVRVLKGFLGLGASAPTRPAPGGALDEAVPMDAP